MARSSTQRLHAAVSGDLEKMMAAELRVAKQAVSGGMRRAADEMKYDLRADVVRGGLGKRLAKSWQSKVYPKGQASLGAAAQIYTKAPKLISAFDKSTVIRSKSGSWLAIPTPSAPTRGLGRKRLTPQNFPEHRYGKLRFVYRETGPSLLVVDDQISRKGKTGGYALTRSKKKLESKEGLSTVPMFFLVRQARLKRRLNVGQVASVTERRLGRFIDEEFQRLDGLQRGR